VSLPERFDHHHLVGSPSLEQPLALMLPSLEQGVLFMRYPPLVVSNLTGKLRFQSQLAFELADLQEPPAGQT
jgi:hypothetical protein